MTIKAQIGAYVAETDVKKVRSIYDRYRRALGLDPTDLSDEMLVVAVLYMGCRELNDTCEFLEAADDA